LNKPQDVAHLQRDAAGKILTNWSINTEFHFGGFARRKPELDTFISRFQQQHGLVLDWVYVAKMMYGIYVLAEREFFPQGSKVIAVVTG
jgi:1-aminocyclopropane-1-carboxylate deaminase